MPLKLSSHRDKESFNIFIFLDLSGRFVGKTGLRIDRETHSNHDRYTISELDPPTKTPTHAEGRNVEPFV